ncbi:hypothetical protein B0T14DRAFT_216830 [Immersiella caudata]|uniref:Uncharacterized protein n=1 Tax=Immersiella caudata TaxID=314043 RepID=A0AA40C084_9PEZI|nr:hypothetical protein B0T14DRAFT_216830 [Immersiella caudata]
MIPQIILRCSRRHINWGSIQNLARIPPTKFSIRSKTLTPRSFSHFNICSPCPSKPLSQQTNPQFFSIRTLSNISRSRDMGAYRPKPNGETFPARKVFFFDIDNCLYPKSEQYTILGPENPASQVLTLYRCQGS